LKKQFTPCGFSETGTLLKGKAGDVTFKNKPSKVGINTFSDSKSKSRRKGFFMVP
jgi:hypothetical protein